MNEFQIKNYLKFVLRNIKDCKFYMECSGEKFKYNFQITEEGISLEIRDAFYKIMDIDSLIFNEDRFKVERIELYKYSNGTLIDKRVIPKPDKTKVYYALFNLMGKRAGLVLKDRLNNIYRGCYASGKILYIEDIEECIKFNITDLASLKLEIVCITDIPSYTTFKSYVSEAEKYAKCINKPFVKYGKKEQGHA